MTDFDRIARIMSDVEKYLAELESYKITEANLKESKTFFAGSMVVFQILNDVLDLCDVLINAKNLGVPSTYKDIFWILEKNKIIGSQMRESVWAIVKYRNVLAHQYGDITNKELLFIVQNLDVLKKFIKLLMLKLKK